MNTMMTARFSRFSRRALLGAAVEPRESSWSGRLGSVLGISTVAPELSVDAKLFAQYTVFKGKAALSMSPMLPTLQKLDSGAYKVDKTGVVMLTFWPAIGVRKYDWQKKQIFALNATEIGSLISLGPAESCEFLHDPSMKSSLEGQVKKSLTIAPLGSDNGYFLNLSVLNTIQKTNERFSVPVTKAEFAVMRTVLSYSLPHIMGWGLALRPQQQSTMENPRRAQIEARPNPEFEWER